MPEYRTEMGCPECGEPYGHRLDCSRLISMKERTRHKRVEERGEAELRDWRDQVVVENKQNRQAQYQRLSSAQSESDLFPTSVAQINEDFHGDLVASQNKYEVVLPPYSYHPPESQVHYWGGDVNVGYKLHLTVPVSSVKSVAGYLKLAGVEHKYLTGGTVDDGKIFTIYCGSKDRADVVAQQISRDLSSDLRRPVAGEEVEFAPNVIGRFTGSQKIWGQYPVGKMRGISALAEDRGLLFGYHSKLEAEKNKLSREAFQRSYDQAAKTYGEYFYGSGQENSTKAK